MDEFVRSITTYCKQHESEATVLEKYRTALSSEKSMYAVNPDLPEGFDVKAGVGSLFFLCTVCYTLIRISAFEQQQKIKQYLLNHVTECKGKPDSGNRDET